MRQLPVLDLPMLPAAALQPARRPSAPAPELVEYVTDDVVMPRFHIWTLGCQMNRSDSEEMAGALVAAGCSEADGMASADLIVIDTCAIRESAEQKVIGRMGVLGRAKEADPRLRVVLTGCSVRDGDQGALKRRYPAVDLFLRPDQQTELVARLGLAGATTADRLPHARATAVAAGAVRREDPISAWLPIIYGCDKTCTYCIVPLSRGPERSRPYDDVLAEARSLAELGYQEVTLLGQNVNSYGHDLPRDARFEGVRGGRRLGRSLDLDGRPDFATLLRAIDGQRDADGHPRIPRLRFVTSHPWDLTDQLIAAMAECPSVCEHLHLPIQSGDDAVLRRMGRQYTVSAYVELVDRLRAAVPEMSVTTDVIVGFSGETDAAFQRTLDLLSSVRYEKVFAAAFSVRPGTPAARLPDDVPPAIKRERLNALLALQEGIGLAVHQQQVGRVFEVLVEGMRRTASGGHVEPAQQLSGRDRQHRLVHLDGPAELIGQRVPVLIERAGPYALVGRLTA